MRFVHLEATVLVGVACFYLLFSPGPSSSVVSAINIKAGRLCGNQLVDALSFVCDGNYHLYRPQSKRYELGAETGENSDGTNDFQGLHQLMVRQNTWNPVSYLVKRATMVRLARGVSDECCEQSCNFAVLSRYCASPSTNRRPRHTPATLATQRTDSELQSVRDY